ncbi:hypothetical protein E2542_SST27366 [Spatholobus suberectus]|nr:hypothetical protein E2542_SST27366 [Spatholobus suberectus]
MANGKVRITNWYQKKITDPLLSIIRRGAEPNQLSFSAALGLTLGVFPICDKKMALDIRLGELFSNSVGILEQDSN